MSRDRDDTRPGRATSEPPPASSDTTPAGPLDEPDERDAADVADTAQTPSHPGLRAADFAEPPTRRTRSGPMEIDPERAAPRGRSSHGSVTRASSPIRERSTPPPLPPLGARAGIHDRRGGLALDGQRLRPLDARTMSVRLSDVEFEDARPAREPLGAAPSLPSAPARMVVFFAPKGGVGATTLACNVGGLLARSGHPAALVDLDLQLGSVPVSLNVTPQVSIDALVDEAARLDGGPLETALDRHAATGLHIAAQVQIEQLGKITVKRLPRLFSSIGGRHSPILVDGLRDFNDHAVATMDLAHLVVIVITQDVPAVRAGARALRIFRRLGYGNDRLLLVVNRYHRRAPVGLDTIAHALGLPAAARVHNDFPLIEQALNQGVLATDIRPRSRPARDLARLAELIAGQAGPPPRRGLIARLLDR